MIRTDQAESYVALHDGATIVAETTWQAHRELSNTLLKTIESELSSVKLSWTDLKGVVVFKGPGSFTGLRIGVTVANTLSYSLEIPVIGSAGEDWVTDGVSQLSKGISEPVVVPEYGGEANITKPRK